MKASWELWQVGWEDERREVELNIDEDECPSCAASKPVSGTDPIVIGFRPTSGGETKYRFMESVEVIEGLVGWMCRKATPEEIASEEEKAKLVREGAMPEMTRAEILAQSTADDASKAALQAIFTDAIEMMLDPAAWAAKKGAEMGAKKNPSAAAWDPAATPAWKKPQS